MFKKLFESKKSVFLILAGVLTLIMLGLVAWRVVEVRRALAKPASAPISKIGYCSAEPEELCILSFGRDIDDKFVVNLFVPRGKFPKFYVTVKRLAGENNYECVQSREDKAIVYCLGDMVNLQEKMEVNLHALKDDRLLAEGDFTLEAMLVFSESLSSLLTAVTSTPEALSSNQEATTLTASTGTPGTPPPGGVLTTPTARPTLPAGTSYPNYP